MEYEATSFFHSFLLKLFQIKHLQNQPIGKMLIDCNRIIHKRAPDDPVNT